MELHEIEYNFQEEEYHQEEVKGILERLDEKILKAEDIPVIPPMMCCYSQSVGLHMDLHRYLDFMVGAYALTKTIVFSSSDSDPSSASRPVSSPKRISPRIICAAYVWPQLFAALFFFCCVRLHMVLIHLFAVSNHTADMRSICLAILIAALFDLYWKINAELDGSLFFWQ
ncbi:hypothetical protein DAPPUDRAFT_107233 [Daphnia pulex]|uniref:Uncharacterized protein n=1 Tax=Daphnia pulex TaxID=6669 RepID=E9GWF3_DAPPU|nr:hypothetical protein DAPPUDRAFT_107233 [Daphnia pulex]|eukprot:EFX76091.1 hypothetical protein DAPPUDRAFT_107233 [Daphnia pulex]